MHIVDITIGSITFRGNEKVYSFRNQIKTNIQIAFHDSTELLLVKFVDCIVRESGSPKPQKGHPNVGLFQVGSNRLRLYKFDCEGGTCCLP